MNFKNTNPAVIRAYFFTAKKDDFVHRAIDLKLYLIATSGDKDLNFRRRILLDVFSFSRRCFIHRFLKA